MCRDAVWEAMPVMYGNVCLCERNVGVRMTMGPWEYGKVVREMGM